MRCRKCNTENDADSVYCIRCGARLEKQPEPDNSRKKRCINCNFMNAADAAFCEKCGLPLRQEWNSEDRNRQEGNGTGDIREERFQKRKLREQRYQDEWIPDERVLEDDEEDDGRYRSKSVLVAAVVLLAAVVIGGGGFGAYTLLKGRGTREVVEVTDQNAAGASGNSGGTHSGSAVSESETDSSSEKDQNQIDAEDAMEANEMRAEQMAGQDSETSPAGTEAFSQTAAQAETQPGSETNRIAQTETQPGSETNRTAQTDISIETEQTEKAIWLDGSFFKDGQPVESTSGYILPDSDDTYLTTADVSNLTVKGISYAKNEIYARHNRKFSSPELSAYFNSMPWYTGTIEPDDFTEEKVNQLFNSCEKENSRFLSDLEESMGAYQYDQ